MAPTIIILGPELSDELRAHLGRQAPNLYGRMLNDTLAVARQLTGVQVVVYHSPSFEPALRDGRDPAVTYIATAAAGATAVRAILRTALATGEPAVLIGGDLPHLPVTRLRDAFTLLAAGAPLVLGPGDHGSWYLLGLASGQEALLEAVPGYGERVDRMIAQLGRQAIHLLPPWFGVRSLNNLETLCDELRSMPAEFATQTRALLTSEAASRAVGG
jgi:glycosyltransferase A (GT-A) superfamily protein (DUF2064 family)